MDPLTERQLEVLRWIADGCPDGVMAGHSHTITARALVGRRLVKITKPSGTWSAAVTDAGSYYLEHGAFPPRNHVAPKPQRPSLPIRDTADEQPRRDSGTPKSTATGTARPAKPHKLSPTEQLVADVVAAGGVLQEPRDSRGNSFLWGARQLVRDANRYGKTPPGKRLVHQFVHEGPHWYGPTFDLFTLVDGPAGTDAPLIPVRVPDEVQRYHPAVSTLRKTKRLDFKDEVLSRALRILHALAVEAERRGFVVTAHQPKTGHGQANQPEPWHLLFTIGGETVPMRIEEESDRVEHVPTPRELKDHERRPWIRIPTHDEVRSGRLRIQIGGQSQLERKASWADRTRWRLDDKLPELLREVGVRADELRLRREAKAKAEEDYRQAVQREEARARARAAEAHRQKALEDQLVNWRAAEELRAYATAVAARIQAAEVDGQADADAIEAARQWLEWITKRADQRDPTTKLATWPDQPKLHSFELREYVNRVPEPEEIRYMPDSY